MEQDLIAAAIAALEGRDEEGLAAEIAARPKDLIAEYSGRRRGGETESEADCPPLDDTQAAALKAALISYILRSRGPYLETALSCLAAYCDAGLKGFFRDQLRKCLTDPERFSGALVQCMSALKELGEPVFSGSEFDPDDTDTNVEMSENYLMRG